MSAILALAFIVIVYATILRAIAIAVRIAFQAVRAAL